MKLGLDVHGVIDTYPFLKELASLLVSNGHEVHIITGAMWEPKAKNELTKLGYVRGIHYTNFFSISDSLLACDVYVDWIDDENPVFDNEIWNRAKSMYCEDKKIDLHIDDSSVYGELFKTPYALLK